jgi:septum formation protein
MPAMDDLPNAYAARTAMEKAVKVGEKHPGHLVIGADTVVALGDQIMGKPRTREEAFSMLNRLSNQWHTVWTGICVYNYLYGLEVVRAVSTEVCFRNLSSRDIEDYVATDEPMDKAGGYAIQGLGHSLIREIKGSYHNVIGLPTMELGKILDDLGISTDSSLSDLTYE